MARYEIRLYKPTAHNPNKAEVVDQIPLEAVDDADAEAKAPLVKIPKWDDSHWAILFSPDGKMIWRLERAR